MTRPDFCPGTGGDHDLRVTDAGDEGCRRCGYWMFDFHRACKAERDQLAADLAAARSELQAWRNATYDDTPDAVAKAVADLCWKNAGLEQEVERLRGELAKTAANSLMVPRRGVDQACENCGALEGSTLVDGWYRCNSCGYPGK